MPYELFQLEVADAFDLANAVKTTAPQAAIPYAAVSKTQMQRATQAEGPAAVRMAALEREAADAKTYQRVTRMCG